jgi:hypothetical protein
VHHQHLLHVDPFCQLLLLLLLLSGMCCKQPLHLIAATSSWQRPGVLPGLCRSPFSPFSLVGTFGPRGLQHPYLLPKSTAAFSLHLVKLTIRHGWSCQRWWLLVIAPARTVAISTS